MSYADHDVREREDAFYRRIISEYLTYGSVDEVFKRNNWELPMSYPGMHHLLKRWGVVKAAGSNSKFSEIVAFLEKLAADKMPLEKLYKELPPSFKTSAQTLHRILSCVREGVTRRHGTALVISVAGKKGDILIGNDVSSPRLEFGKQYGSLSLPMGFAHAREPRERSILRVLQREAMTEPTVNRQFPYEIIPDNPEPLMHLYIADVSVAVYDIQILPEHVGLLSSGVLENLNFVSAEVLAYADTENNFRTGVDDIALHYLRYLAEPVELPMLAVSKLNLALNPALVGS